LDGISTWENKLNWVYLVKYIEFGDTTGEQAKKTLHSHVLLFVAGFDRLISMLWSGTEHLRKKAEKELIEYMKKTMSSSYGLFEEDYMHPLQDSSSKNLDHLNRGNIITSISKQNDSDQLCRILLAVFPDQTLRNMRHKKGSHILKGTIGRCEGCKQQFTTSTLIWNAIDRWNNLVQDSNSYF
jgi:hypothetical protein